MKCQNCGNEFDKGSFCPKCGTQLKEEIKITRKKPFYKRWWFWILVIIFVFFMISLLGSEDEEYIDEDSIEESIVEDENTLSYNLEEDLANNLLYYNEYGQIVDEYGEIIPEYSSYVVLEDGTIALREEIEKEQEANNNEESKEFDGIPENPNDSSTVDDAITDKFTETINDGADSFINKLFGWGISMSDDSVDKRNIGMYYGTWYDQETGNYIYISEGDGKRDYLIDLSSLGYGANNEGTFTASQTIYMGDLGMGIIMNEDGSIYVEHISISGQKNEEGPFVKQ